MKRTLFLGALGAILFSLAAPAAAQDMVKVKITNVSRQIISPPLVVTHSSEARVFRPGRPASDELAALAEDGDASALVALLETSDAVLDIAVANGPLLPGQTVVFELESQGQFNLVSAVGMLVTTNDAFFGLDSHFARKNGPAQRLGVPAWDAGTEYNSESCDYIPGPPCGNPMMRDTDGAEGIIHTHPGIYGVGDLSAADYNWQNPAVDIVVARK
jgi:hypothetical protein